MTITTPQPEYISETHEIVDEALEQREQAPSSEQYFKLVPTSADWLNARNPHPFIVCPVCATPVYQDDVDEHTRWHETVATVIQMIAG